MAAPVVHDHRAATGAVPLREMQRAARHTRADTTVANDQSDQSFHRDPTFVLMTATAR